MSTIKSHLQNLQTQINLLIGFYLENESLLSSGLIQIMDQAKLNLKDLMELKNELIRKTALIESLEIVLQNPRYFVMESPLKMISENIQNGYARFFSSRLQTFNAYANPLAMEMHKSNLELLEALPPLYREILCKSRKNKKEGFKDFLSKLVYENPYPKNLSDGYQQILEQVVDQCKSKVSLSLLQKTLNQKI
jgi:hypothetical protein